MLFNNTFEKTSTEQIFTKAGIFGGVLVITDGVNNAVVNVYDVSSSGDAAAGTKIFETTVSGPDHYGGIIFPHPLKLKDGLYITISGTGASFIAYYKGGR